MHSYRSQETTAEQGAVCKYNILFLHVILFVTHSCKICFCFMLDVMYAEAARFEQESCIDTMRPFGTQL